MYPKPSGKRPGKWVHVEGELEHCKNGLHACRKHIDLLQHTRGTSELAAWLCETKGDCIDGGDKTAFRSLRLVKRLHWDDAILRLFAADCAERALSNAGVTDERSWNAVRVARLFALGEVTVGDLAAAWAAWAADAVWAAADAAADAAGDAAWGAARDAAWAAARDAERDWQNRRFTQYLNHGTKAMNMECK